MADEEKKVKKVQAKFPIGLVRSIEKSKGFKSMNNFLKRIAIKEVKYKEEV
jgi:hypothetical protein